ncbi:U-box domain-containing protein 42 [Pyrus ussuriensis x Pyrus communis]|uniref:U-box domain-containing protein 42 n=1 Tax=Pyrus ussuriensis x Pyrus communis TaxID=2448454 RepID=A0A5N5HDX7_9ROSA|nr:U-box domain-containing protein 42 [Pyrus ussuriensis x Pyrus communis]
MLSSSHQSVRHASLLFLLELSRSQSLCEKIGSEPLYFRALAQLSSYHPNGKLLQEAGIIQVMVEEMFIKQTNGLKSEAAAILASIFESGHELENLPANSHAHYDFRLCCVSAIGLENLSAESIKLSKPPQIKRKKSLHLPKYLPCGSPRRRNPPLCPVHRGICSSQYTSALLMRRRFRGC